MTGSLSKVSVVGICVFVALFVASSIQAQDKVKLTGAELQELLKPGAVSFGIDHKASTVWIIVSHGNGKRSVYSRSLANPDVWIIQPGTAEIVADQLCAKWTFGPERCYDIYRIGEDKRESWQQGSLVSTWYRGQRSSEKAKKEKVRITGAELQDFYSTPQLLAGINHRNNSLWLIAHRADGTRDVYWRSVARDDLSGSGTGTSSIVSDQLCTKWASGAKGRYDVYRIGVNKYEALGPKGSSDDHTFYRLK